MLHNNMIGDSELVDELMDKMATGRLPFPHATTVSESRTRSIIEDARANRENYDIEAESIVQRFGRPVLLIRNDTFEEPQSEVWRKRLNSARLLLNQVIPSVGRIEVREHPIYNWVGTGWLVTSDIIVTNRHVAKEFSESKGDGFVFKKNFLGRQMMARVDFAEEYLQPTQEEFRLTDVLYVEDKNGHDIALFRVDTTSASVYPIPLATTVSANQRVVVIGYPAKDSRIPDQPLMNEIYNNIYDVKRLAPGEVMETTKSLITHDCTTLGGNSGSIVVNIENGEAVGLHFSGSYMRKNYAVHAVVVSDLLAKL